MFWQWLRNLAVSRKLFFAFSGVCILCLGLGTYTFLTLRDIASISTEVSDNAFPAVIALTNVRGAFSELGRADLDELLCQTPSCLSDQSAKRQRSLNDFQASLKAYEAAIRYSSERETYQRFTSAFARYREASDRSNALLAAGKTGDALDLAHLAFCSLCFRRNNGRAE
jgi:methyl-accepting chemotaxis protein